MDERAPQVELDRDVVVALGHIQIILRQVLISMFQIQVALYGSNLKVDDIEPIGISADKIDKGLDQLREVMDKLFAKVRPQ